MQWQCNVLDDKWDQLKSYLNFLRNKDIDAVGIEILFEKIGMLERMEKRNDDIIINALGGIKDPVNGRME